MRTILKWGVYILSLISISAMASTLNLEHAFQRSAQNKIELLFVLPVSQAILQPQAKMGHYRLTLLNVPRTLIYFTNEPQRKAGRVTLNYFFQLYHHDHIIPNVALTAYDLHSHHDVNAIFALSAPHFDRLHKVLTYQARALNLGAPNAVGARHLKDVNLFIDGFHPWPP